MEPNLRHWISLFGPPRENGVRLSTNEAPVYRADFIFVEERDVCLELRVKRAGHVFGAYSRSPILKHLLNCVVCVLRILISMEGNDV